MATPEELSADGRAAARAGVVGNYVDNLHMFAPLLALPPALDTLVGPGSNVATGAVVVIAMLLGRPLGGALFGQVSDRIGRSRTTRIALAGTVICAVGIAALPTYEVIGSATVGLLLLARFCGGIFIAGEYSAAIPLAMEWSPPRRRGFASGLILSMAPWAQASVAFVTALLVALLGPSAYAAWGWRLIFLAAASGSVGMMVYYRTHVVDSPEFHRAHALTGRSPIAHVLTGPRLALFGQTFALMSGLWLLTTATVLILPGELNAAGHLGPDAVAIVMGCASVGQAVAMVGAGHLSSLVGRRATFIGWGACAAVAGPLAWLGCVSSARVETACAWAVATQVVTVAAYGPVAAYLSERFPTRVRSTGYGMAYSWSLVLPALYPFYVPALAAWVGSRTVACGLIVGGALIVLGAAACGPALRPGDMRSRRSHG